MIITNLIVTAYCACRVCCGPQANGLTASGAKPQQGITVAGPRRYPLGSKVIVKGHTYLLQDRLAKRYDNRIDIYFNNHKDAAQFGKQFLAVTIITTKPKQKP